MVATLNGQKIGQIVQVIGSTFDIEFEEGHLPDRLGHGTMEAEVQS